MSSKYIHNLHNQSQAGSVQINFLPERDSRVNLFGLFSRAVPLKHRCELSSPYCYGEQERKKRRKANEINEKM